MLQMQSGANSTLIVNQTFKVPDNAATISIYCNFITDAERKNINPNSNDIFEVTLIDDNGNSIQLLTQNIQTASDRKSVV